MRIPFRRSTYFGSPFTPAGTCFNLINTAGAKHVLVRSGFVGSARSGFSAYIGSGTNQSVTIPGTAVADSEAVISLSGAHVSVRIGATGQVIGLEPEADGVDTFAIFLNSGGSVENAGTMMGQEAGQSRLA